MSDKNLDPMPWQVYVNGQAEPGWRRTARKERFTNGFGQIINDRFEPGDDYSQKRGDYTS
jgi:hypothetical protein